MSALYVRRANISDSMIIESFEFVRSLVAAALLECCSVKEYRALNIICITECVAGQAHKDLIALGATVAFAEGGGQEVDIGPITLSTKELRFISVKKLCIDGNQDVRLWRCGELQTPCGGTHIDRPWRIGHLGVRLKGTGFNKEKLICQLPNAQLDLKRYQGAIL